MGLSSICWAVSEQAVELFRDLFFGLHGEIAHIGRVGVPDELPVHPVVAGWEGQDLPAQAHQVLGLAGEGPFPVREAPVVQGPDADGVPGSDELPLGPVPQDQGELRVQRFEHLHAVFVVEGQQYLAVGLALKIVFRQQPLPKGPKAVKLPVAHHRVLVEAEGLHAPLVEAHDGQAVEAQIAAGDLFEPAHVRPPGRRALKAGLQFLHWDRFAGEAADGTHKKAPPFVGRRSF